jgi:hypothetical protein
MHRTKTIRYQALDYEIFWTSQHVRHICSNYHVDSLHDVDHEDISWLLENYFAVEPTRNDRVVFLTWSSQRGRLYETHVVLEGATRTRTGRCVVLTSHQSTNIRYLFLLQSLPRT